MRHDHLALCALMFALAACGVNHSTSRSSASAVGGAGDGDASSLPETGADPGPSIGVATTAGTPSSASESATTLAFSSPPLAQASGVCGAVSLQAQLNAAATVLISNHSIALASSAASGSFFSDASCATALPGSVLVLASGSSSGVFYYRDSAVGTPTLTATDGSTKPLSQATQSATIVAGAAAKLAFITPALSQQAAACAAVTLASQDSAGNAANTSADLLLTLDPAAGAFFSDNTCMDVATQVTMVNGSATAIVYYKSSALGQASVTATPAPGSVYSAATLSVTIVPTPFLAFDSLLTAPSINSCMPLSVKLGDGIGGAGALTADASFALAAVGSAPANLGQFYFDPSCASPVAAAYVLGGGDAAFTVYLKAAVADTYSVTVTPVGSSPFTPLAASVMFH